MPVVYKTFYSKQYKADCCSCVSFVTIAIYLLTIVLPYVFVFQTSGLWKENSVYYEHPNVDLTNEFLLEILDSDGVSWQYSTVKKINDRVMNPMSPPIFQISQHDENGDQKADHFVVKISFKNDPRKLRQVRLLTVAKYSLRQKLKISMQSILDLNVETPQGAAKIISNGHIVLKQRKNTIIDSITRVLYDVNPFLVDNFEKFNVNDIVDKHDERIEKVEYDTTTMVQPMGQAFTTSIEMKMIVPSSQPVSYRPGVLETVKFGFVQYIMILLPLLWIVNSSLSFLFKYRVLDAQLVSDLKPKRKIM